jgi:hypothetical protein
MNTCHCEDRSQMEKTYCVVRVQATLHCAPVLAVEWWRAWVAKARQQMRHSTLLRWAASLQPATLLFQTYLIGVEVFQEDLRWSLLTCPP